MKTIHFVFLNACPILEQLQIEEALLRSDQRNWCLINWGSPAAIVMGISGKIETLLNRTLLEKNPVPVIRRFSGGGTVVVDENTCFITMICNEEAVSVPPFPDHVLRWNGAFYQPILAPHPFQIIENDYVLGEKKFGGNAQYLSKKRWLHHTSLLWDYDDKKMEYLLLPSKMPAYRQRRNHSDFLCKLKNFIPSKKFLLDLFLSQLNQQFHLTKVSENDVRCFQNNPHRRSTTRVSFE